MCKSGDDNNFQSQLKLFIYEHYNDKYYPNDVAKKAKILTQIKLTIWKTEVINYLS